MRNFSALLFVLSATLLQAQPLGTAITYQGELTVSGAPAEGDFDLEFRLFDQPESGTEIVPVITIGDEPVTGGRFAVELDFGPTPYAGDQLWLQVSVRPGDSTSGYQQLLPRQKLNPVPYALHAEMVALNAIASTEIVDGSISGSDINTSQVQSRVTGSCPAGSAIQSVSATGQVQCETDDGLNYAGVICSAEQVIVGFQPNGQPLCADGGQLGVGCPVNVSAQLGVASKVDFIIVVDNSASMPTETAALELALNPMALALENAGTDYRFVMVTDHGAGSTEVCVPTPLSGTTNCALPAVSGERFFHYDLDILSHDSLCKLLDGLEGTAPDESGFFAGGFGSLLRADAYRALIQVGDDGVICTSSSTGVALDDSNSVVGGQSAAATFNNILLAQYPDFFGTPDNQNYTFYALVGVPENGTGTTPYTSADEVTTNECSGAVDPGTGYQWLAKTSEGLWFSQCATADYTSMFQQIAQAADAAAIPDPTCTISTAVPPSRSLDPSSILVSYEPSSGSPVSLSPVADAGACTSNSYFLQGNADVTLCPAICATVQADVGSSVSVQAGCEWPP